MTLRPLVLLLVLGCATSRGSVPEPEPPAAPEPAVAAAEDVCDYLAVVTVHVENRGPADVEVSFGIYTPVRAAPGLSRTTYDVPRSYLQSSIRLRIARGGLQVGGPARIATEPVVCNDATLVIGTDLRSSFFYGGLVVGRSPRR
jgi:hypothetical protein